MNDVTYPQVIHLGKKSKKEIKKYKQGIGTTFLEVQHVIQQAKKQVGADKEILPIVVTHRRKNKRFWKSIY